ncbi:MAG: tRNA pseudouridine(55) synthase TruB [Deltaproteobacteria bacterium]|nr:tRNA pseudouridine(55) synthase TruB [Deltaproteobacteria bacterium]
MTSEITEGILLVDKPKGLTSFDVVARVRRECKTRSVGHTGTLDPFATGLLVILLGRYTRLSNYLTAQDKTYEAQICLGIGTDTDDCDGKEIARADASHITQEVIQEALKSFLGDQLQVPPQYSAISINGERAYKKARRGEVVEHEPRPIIVHELDFCHPGLEPGSSTGSRVIPYRAREPGMTQDEGEVSVNIRLKVSKGTYIRAIARDLGAKLGVPAHLTELRRTASGPYQVVEVTGKLLTGVGAIRGVPLVSINMEQSEALKKGQRPICHPGGGQGLDAGLRQHDSTVALAHLEDEPIALVRVEKGVLVPIRGF